MEALAPSEGGSDTGRRCKIVAISSHTHCIPNSEVQCMKPSPNSLFAQTYHCLDCGSEVGFRSRRRTLAERYLLPLFLLQPVRCGECFRRDYRLIFTRVSDRLSETPRMMPKKQTVPDNPNV